MTDEEEFEKWFQSRYRSWTSPRDLGLKAWPEAKRKDRARIEALLKIIERLGEEELSSGGRDLIDKARKEGLL